MKKLLASLLLLLAAPGTFAQGIVEKVNAIKMSDDYIWEEYTHPHPDTAQVKATEWLLLHIEEPEGKTLTAADILPYVKHINMKRTTLTRVFVYMKKGDVAEAVKRKQEGPKQEQAPQPAPPAEQPIAEQPAPVVQFKPDALVQALMSQKDLYAAYSLLEDRKQNGEVSAFGAPKDTNTLADKRLALFSQENLAPVCVLSEEQDGGKRTNLMTGKPDAMDNHHQCYAIWFTTK